MRVEFRNGGSLLEVAATTSSFNVTGGTISNLTKVADGNYTFRLTPSAPGTVTLAMAAGVKDSENRDMGGGTGQVVFGQGGLYRPNDLLAYFDFDENTGDKAYNEGTQPAMVFIMPPSAMGPHGRPVQMPSLAHPQPPSHWFYCPHFNQSCH